MFPGNQVLMQGFSVAQWLEYGLRLPQYREAFMRNAVTVLDFPLILKQPDLLQQDLGVTSLLHSRQISRAVRNVALGIGTLPASVRTVQHSATAEGSIAVTWQAPNKVLTSPACFFDYSAAVVETLYFAAKLEFLCSIWRVFNAPAAAQ